MKKYTTSDYLNFDTATRVAEKLMKGEGSKKTIGLYIAVSINTGLRISDVLNLKWSDLMSKDRFSIIEGKTKKRRAIAINENIKKALKHFAPRDTERLIFRSQKNTKFSRQQINRVLKQVFNKEAQKLNISSHSLRKTFGRRVYENNGESEKALIYLSELFNHTSMATTKRYLGIRQNELNNLYLNL